MIKNIVFDIGNVVLKFNPKEYFSREYKNLDSIDMLCDLMMESDIWRSYDLGDIHLEDVREAFAKAAPTHQEEINEMLNHWTDILEPIEYTFNKMKELRCQGYSLYLLSNLNEEAYDYILRHYDLFDIVDGYIVSFKERLAKPDFKIYDCLMNRYQLYKEECVFIDDLEKNVDAAIRYGMQGIVFQNEEQVEKELNRILENKNVKEKR